jgi:hypothetical protein
MEISGDLKPLFCPRIKIRANQRRRVATIFLGLGLQQTGRGVTRSDRARSSRAPNPSTWKFRPTVEKICATGNAVSLRPTKGNSPDETRKSTGYQARVSTTCPHDK